MDLKQRRKQACLTQAELARRVGCGKERIGMVERGVGGVSGKLVAKMEVALGVRSRIPERTVEEEWFHELWIERYG